MKLLRTYKSFSTRKTSYCQFRFICRNKERHLFTVEITRSQTETGRQSTETKSINCTRTAECRVKLIVGDQRCFRVQNKRRNGLALKTNRNASYRGRFQDGGSNMRISTWGSFRRVDCLFARKGAGRWSEEIRNFNDNGSNAPRPYRSERLAATTIFRNVFRLFARASNARVSNVKKRTEDGQYGVRRFVCLFHQFAGYRHTDARGIMSIRMFFDVATIRMTIAFSKSNPRRKIQYEREISYTRRPNPFCTHCSIQQCVMIIPAAVGRYATRPFRERFIVTRNAQ